MSFRRLFARVVGGILWYVACGGSITNSMDLATKKVKQDDKTYM